MGRRYKKIMGPAEWFKQKEKEEEEVGPRLVGESSKDGDVFTGMLRTAQIIKISIRIPFASSFALFGLAAKCNVVARQPKIAANKTPTG